MDRTTTVPDRALNDLLKSLTQRVESAEMRGAWPSVMRESSIVVNETNFVTPTNDAIGEPLDYREVMSLQLEPGRWILFGSVTHEAVFADIPDAAPYEFHVKVSSHDPLGVVAERERTGYDYAISLLYPFVIRFDMVAAETISDHECTARLWVAASGRPGGANFRYDLHTATLLAFPG